MNDKHLPRDVVLPQLARALDAQAMARCFASALRGEMQLISCGIDRVKYRPQRSCSVSYRLQLRDARSGRRFEQGVAARFLGGGAAALRHAKALQDSLLPSPAGPAVQHDAGLDMLAFWWPNDAKLGVLQLLADDHALRAKALCEVAAALGGDYAGHTTTLVQVVPELRACAQIALSLKNGSLHRLYAKADLEGSGAAMQTVMLAFAHDAAQADGRLRTPQPLLWQAHTGLHWQHALRGVTLLQTGTPLGPALSAAIGRQLAALHAVPVSDVPTTNAAELMATMQQAGESLVRVDASWAPRIERTVRRLALSADALRGHAHATLHGDLHLGNLLWDGEQLGLIDFDAVHRGPAVLELGAWAAYTMARALWDDKPLASAAHSWQAFINAYAEASGTQPDPGPVAWCCAQQLLCRRAWGGLATLKPGRLAQVPRLLALADAIAEQGRVDAAWSAQQEAA